jgi:hypothetical protein
MVGGFVWEKPVCSAVGVDGQIPDICTDILEGRTDPRLLFELGR